LATGKRKNQDSGRRIEKNRKKIKTIEKAQGKKTSSLEPCALIFLLLVKGRLFHLVLAWLLVVVTCTLLVPCALYLLFVLHLFSLNA